MKQIESIRATGLLGSMDLEWRLQSGVNILSGHNGSGKSTLLRSIAKVVLGGEQPHNQVIDTVDVRCVDEQKLMPCDLLVLNRDLGGFEPLGAEISGFSDGDFKKFCDIVDEMLEQSGKRISRNVVSHRNLNFILTLPKGDEVEIGYQYLSAGERLAISLFGAILERPTASVLIIDEPEVSLGMEWQKHLIENILELRPQLQILIATHSPAIIMRGWVNRVTEIETLILNNNKF